MKWNTAWAVSMVVGIGAAACNGERTPQNPLESPVGEVQTAGAPRTVVRIADAFKDNHWINDIAIDGDDLYVATAWDGVYRLPKFGGGITALDETANNTEYSEVATGDGAVIWEAASFDKRDFPTNHLRRVATGDTTASTIYQAALGGASVTGTKDVQIDGSIVYFTEVMNVTDAGAIHRVPTHGGAELPSILPFTLQETAGPYNPTQMPTSWIVKNGGVFLAYCPGDGSCAVERVSADGTQTIATFPGDVAYVRAADETSIYVTNRFYNAAPPNEIPPIPLLKIDQQTGAIVQLTADGSDAWFMLADDQELFFAAFNTGITINAISKQGGDQRIVADLTASHGFSAMAQDDTYLFVLTPVGEGPYQNKVIAIPKHPPAP
jgi:hypothetical protein